MSFLEESGIMVVIDWPPHSPDMNVIENVLKMLSDNREGKEFTNLNDVWSFLEKNFYSILDSYNQKLFESIRRRIRANFKHRGYPTNY